MKKENKGILKIASLLTLAVVAATPAIAAPGRGFGECDGEGPLGHQGIHMQGGHGHHGGKHFGGKRMDPAMMLIHASDRLELTDEQEVKLLKLSQSHRENMKAHREAAKAAHQKLQALKDSGEFDEDAIRAAAAEMHPIMTEGMVLKAKFKADIDSVLTDEQKEKVEVFKQKMKKRFEAKKGAKGLKGEKGKRGMNREKAPRLCPQAELE